MITLLTKYAISADNEANQIKDSTGQAATFNVTVAGNGHNIDGGATFVMNIAYGAITVAFTGVVWSIV